MSSLLSSIVTNSPSKVTLTSSSDMVTVIDGTDHTRIGEMSGISPSKLLSTTLWGSKYNSHKISNGNDGCITGIRI